MVTERLLSFATVLTYISKSSLTFAFFDTPRLYRMILM